MLYEKHSTSEKLKQIVSILNLFYDHCVKDILCVFEAQLPGLRWWEPITRNSSPQLCDGAFRRFNNQTAKAVLFDFRVQRIRRMFYQRIYGCAGLVYKGKLKIKRVEKIFKVNSTHYQKRILLPIFNHEIPCLCLSATSLLICIDETISG